MAYHQMPSKILVVDDDPLILMSTKMLLQNHGEFHVEGASSGSEAIQKVKAAKEDYALIIMDYRMELKNGADTAAAILSFNPNVYVLMLSGDPSREALKASWKAGAVGFIEKGESPQIFLNTVKNWCRKYQETYQAISPSTPKTENELLIASIKMVGRSQALANVAEKVIRYRELNDPILIQGETGTGKEMAAHELHTGSENSFYAVNCASYNKNCEFMESELFGYFRGAFTGAIKDHEGIFRSAKGGTVFLDEIHTLDLKAQQKLLRVIQERKVRPLGSVREYPVDFRLIAAAKPLLEKMLETGEFFPDLFERLNVLKINIPPLKKRPEDIDPLIAFFCEKFEKETGERKRFLVRTVKYLEKYSWPRNVRELENLVRRLCIDSPTDKISPEQLDAKFFETSENKSPPLKRRMNQMLKSEVEEVLKSSRSQRDAAKKLGMPESSFRRLLKQFKLSRTTYTNTVLARRNEVLT